RAGWSSGLFVRTRRQHLPHFRITRTIVCMYSGMLSRQKGLARYGAVLLEAGVDLQTLCEMTADDLRKLAIPPSAQNDIASIIFGRCCEPERNSEAIVLQETAPPPRHRPTQARTEAEGVVPSYRGASIEHPGKGDSARRSTGRTANSTSAQEDWVSTTSGRDCEPERDSEAIVLQEAAPPPRQRTKQAWTEADGVVPSYRGTSVARSSVASSRYADSARRTTGRTDNSMFSVNQWFAAFVDDNARLSHRAIAQKNALRRAGLLLVPVFLAFRAISFKWASNNGTPEFSLFLPPMVAALIGAGLGSLVLLARHGVDAARKLIHKQYMLVCGMGILRASLFASENVALANIDALLFVVTQKFAVCPLLIMEAIAYKKCPADALQLLTIVNALVGICLHMVLSLSDDADVSLLGVIFTVLSAMLYALADTLMGYLSVRRMADTEDAGAERIRCLIVAELSKAVVLMFVSLTFEPSFLLDKGMLHGWDYKVVIGGVLVPELKVIWLDVMVMVSGALSAHLAASLDIAVTYVLEVVVFRTKDFGATALLLVMITCALLAYFLHMMLLVRAQEDALVEVRSKLVSRFSQDSVLTRRLSQTSLGIPSPRA
ncbi:unnamed protein product, partial [Prorocentrum cordatum]